jgi:threonine/homoserine/homoserine lactone efflux protein
VVKLLGAAYLVGLGARTLWRSRGRAGAPGTPALPPVRPLPWAGRGDLVQGFLGNVLNPKAAAVYLTLAPQFLPAGQSVLPAMLALGAAHLVVAAGWLVVWTCVVSASRRTLASHRFRRVLDRISGAVLIGLGLRTAAAAR